MRHLSIDLETYSSVDIKKAGLYKYVQSPDFEILLFAYSIDGGPVEILDLASGGFESCIPLWLINAIKDPNIIKHAYNAAFEWYCLSKYLGFQPAQAYAMLPQWRCTMFHGLYCGYPAGLTAINEALGLPNDKRKLSVGSALIKLFCTPCKPTAANGHRTRTLPHHEPQKWELFKQYCKQDVVAEMEVERRLSTFPVPESEQRLWCLDQVINVYGVAVDPQLVDGALHCDQIITGELMAEAVQISGLDNPKSVKQLTEWLAEETGEEVDNLQKGTVKKLLGTVNSDTARRMLEIRQELAKTSIKKYAAMKEAVCSDGRIRGLLQFYGANRTGRWAGRLVQVQNLPRNYIETLSHARECVKGKKVDALKLIYGNVPDVLSQLIRTAFIPSPGHLFLVADFSAIEARIIAWYADEKWRLDVFATHGKIYEASASTMFGVPIELIKKGNPEYVLRQKGKIAELALGYQGGVGALIAMGALDMGLTQEELPDIVQRWRQANKRIVDLWYSVENAAFEVMKTGQPVGLAKGLVFARECDTKNDLDFLTITLPSARKLYYVKPVLKIETTYTVEFKNDMGISDTKKVKTLAEIEAIQQAGNVVTSIKDFTKESLYYWGLNQTTKKWEQMPTYGGKLVENIVQATARDCLACSLDRLAAAGYQTAFHVHDEVVLDVPENLADLDRVCDIMGQPIPWAPGLLLRADGFVTPYYCKE